MVSVSESGTTSAASFVAYDCEKPAAAWLNCQPNTASKFDALFGIVRVVLRFADEISDFTLSLQHLS